MQSSRLGVDLLLYKSKPTDKREQYDRRTEKNLAGIDDKQTHIFGAFLRACHSPAKYSAHGRLSKRRFALRPNFYQPSIQLYCSCLSVLLLSYQSRLTLRRLHQRNKIERADYSTIFLQSSRIRVNLLLYESKPTKKQDQYNCIKEKNGRADYPSQIL